MKVHTLVLVAAFIASNSTICTSAERVCTGTKCRQESRMLAQHLARRQEPPPPPLVPSVSNSEFTTEDIPIVTIVPTSGIHSLPTTFVDVSETFLSSLETPSNSLESTFDSNTLEPTVDETSSDIPTPVPSSSFSDVNESVTPTPTDVPSLTSEIPPSSTEELPSPTEIPPSSTEVPPSSSEVPSSSTEVPTSDTEIPSSTETQPSTSEVLPSTTETPIAPSESLSTPSEIFPTTTGDLPSATSNIPDPTSDSSTGGLPLPTSDEAGDKKESSGNKTGAIVGGVVGGIAFIAAISGFIGYRYYRKKKQFADVNFDFDDIAMSSPPPTAGFSGGPRLNAINPASSALSHNKPAFDAVAAVGAGIATGAMAKQQDSHYRSPSLSDHHLDSLLRRDYTNSQVSSQPSFVSTDAFIGSVADQNQRNQHSPERPSNNHHTVMPTPYERPHQYYNSEHMLTNNTPLTRFQDRAEFSAPQSVTQDNNRLAPSLARDSTLRSSVTSSSAGPGINEADLEETVIVGFDRNGVNRSNTSLSNRSLELNSNQSLSAGSDLPLFTMTAVEPYMPERPNELLVQPDDELIITEEVGDQWFIGYNRTRNPDVKGYFPRNCVVGGYY